MHGFGPVPVEASEAFHSKWELRMAAMMLDLLRSGRFTIDAMRHGIERMDPAHYLRAMYFERWRTSAELNLSDAGVLPPDELEKRFRRLQDGPRPSVPARTAEEVAVPRVVPPSFVRAIERQPLFRAGEAVRSRNLNPPGHTRLPGYVRGRLGRIDGVYPGFVFPDTSAHGQGDSHDHAH